MRPWQRAAQLLRQFAAGTVTNYVFESEWQTIAGDDRVLNEIGLVIWRFYDDLNEHRLTGRHALNEKGAALFERCALFLETETVYEWIIGGRGFFRWRILPGSRLGDRAVWPFFRASDYLSCAAAGRSSGTA